MKLYTIVNHWSDAVYACSSLADAKESLDCELEALRDNDKAMRSRPFRHNGQILGMDGYVFAEIQELDVDLLWDIETLAVLQQANNL